jgi:hypothetical protein
MSPFECILGRLCIGIVMSEFEWSAEMERSSERRRAIPLYSIR